MRVLKETSVDSSLLASPARSPFSVDNAPNVILETIKRGDDDKHTDGHPTTVILRLYEAFGGHAKARLRIASRLSIKSASLVNFLEDEVSALEMTSVQSNDGGADARDVVLPLDFRGFQVVTVKLVLNASPP